MTNDAKSSTSSVKEVVLNIEGASELAPGSPASTVKTKILVCEDSTLIRKMIAKLLQSNGFNVVEAVNGQQAINKMYDSEKEPFSLLICDLMLPDITGLDVVAQLRKNPPPSVPPILICSARRERQVILAACKLGVAGYIAKPFKTEEFMSRVRSCLQAGRTSAAMPAIPPQSEEHAGQQSEQKDV